MTSKLLYLPEILAHIEGSMGGWGWKGDRRSRGRTEMKKARSTYYFMNLVVHKAMVLSAVMYGCESWTIKKAVPRRIYAFDLWCWRRLLSIPWTARKSNQSILKEISPEYSLEGLVLKLKLQYLDLLM